MRRRFGGEGGCGGPVFSIRNMHEREGVFSSFLNLLTSRRFGRAGRRTARIPHILSSGSIAHPQHVRSWRCSLVRRG